MTEQHKTVFDILFRKILTSQNHYFCFILEISVHVRIHANQILYTCLSKKKKSIFPDLNYCYPLLWVFKRRIKSSSKKEKEKSRIKSFILLFYFISILFNAGLWSQFPLTFLSNLVLGPLYWSSCESWTLSSFFFFFYKLWSSFKL